MPGLWPASTPQALDQSQESGCAVEDAAVGNPTPVS